MPMPPKTKHNSKNDEKVRKFSDSVYRPGEFIFAFIMMYLLFAAFDVLLLVYAGTDTWEVKALLGFSVSGYVFPIISIVSAKRSHSSKFWRSVARVCYKDGYLKVDDTHPRDRDE